MSDPMSEFAEVLRNMAMAPLSVAPGVDTLIAACRRNIEAVTAANRVTLEGAQALARRQMEIVQQTMDEISATVQAATEPGTPQERATRQTERLKQVYAQALDEARELRDMIEHANAEAMGVLNARFLQALDEVKGLIDQTAKPSEPAANG